MIIEFDNKYSQIINQFHDDTYYRIDYGLSEFEPEQIDRLTYIRSSIDLKIGIAVDGNVFRQIYHSIRFKYDN